MYSPRHIWRVQPRATKTLLVPGFTAADMNVMGGTPVIELHTLDPAVQGPGHRLVPSQRTRAGRAILWLVTIALLLSGWILIGGTIDRLTDAWVRLSIGAVALCGAVALILELRGRRSLARLSLTSLAVIAIARFTFVGVLVFIVYPAAAALRAL